MGNGNGRTELTKETIVFKNIQHTTHLTENQYARPSCFQESEHFIEDNHLARVFDEMLVSSIGWSRFLKYGQWMYHTKINITHGAIK